MHGLAFAAQLACGDEAAHLADFDDDAATIETADGAGEYILRFQQLLGLFPIALGSGAGDTEQEVAIAVFAHDIDRHLVANGHLPELAFQAVNLPAGDDTFGLISDVNQQLTGAFIDNNAIPDVACLWLVYIGIVEFFQEQGHWMVVPWRPIINLDQEIWDWFHHCDCLLI